MMLYEFVVFVRHHIVVAAESRRDAEVKLNSLTAEAVSRMADTVIDICLDVDLFDERPCESNNPEAEADLVAEPLWCTVHRRNKKY